MICNVGKTDRIVRALTAVVLIGVALLFIPTVLPKVVVLGAAVLLLLSAWFGVCYVYKLFGTSSAQPSTSRGR
jgi:uncharacterized membrane protein